MGFEMGDRACVVKGALDGYYGHIRSTRPCVGIRIQANGCGETNPRFLSGEWFLPLDYLAHID